ncbi:hypothetical protein CRYUN_Cryun09bG0128500 [Craigia yunnanensis]
MQKRSVCEMAKRELMKPSFLLLIALLLLLAIMFHCKVATSSFSWSCHPACLMELTRKRKLLDMQRSSGYVPSPDDYDYNDFYGRQGNVPSPGVGH